MRGRVLRAAILACLCWMPAGADELARDSPRVSIRGDAAARPARAPLRVTWVEEARLDPFAFVQMENESRGILASIGLQLRLRRGEPVGHRLGGFRALLTDRPVPVDRAVLAADIVPRSHAGIAQIRVYAPEIRNLLRRRFGWSASHLWEGTLLGRVLVHEIVHALVPGLRHASDGLMARTFSPDALFQPVRIDPETLAALQDADTGSEIEADEPEN